MLISFLFACSEPLSEEVVRSAVLERFKKDNPSSESGRIGWELVGKGNWFKGAEFNTLCLADSDIAFQHHNKAGYITPTYVAQELVTASTKRGYCVDLGSNLRLEIVEVSPISQSSSSYDVQRVKTKMVVDEPTPFFNCLEQETLEREIFVEGVEENGAKVASLDPKTNLFFQEGSTCPVPLTKHVKRAPLSRPEAKPPKSLSVQQAKELAQRFDDLLYERNFQEAYELVSCVDLFAEPEKQWGNCALSEVLPIGPSTHGEPRMEDGTAWLEGVQYSVDAIERVVADKKDPTLFHVIVPHRKTKKKRSFSVQWVEGQWRMLGAVSIYSAGLTPLRMINDLHDKKTREFFERRLNGDKIDHKGNPLDPNAEEEEDKKE